MAERYLKATGNWADNNTWSATDGGAAGATFPTSSDNVHFTANGDGLTLTVAASAYCIDFVADAANTATVAGASNISATGNVTLHANMTLTHTGILYCAATTTGKTLTSAGNVFGGQVWFNGAGGGYTLQDALNCGANSLVVYRGAPNTNGQTVTCGIFYMSSADTKVLTLGASTINCSAWVYDGSNLTLTANTATINVSGTGAFTGGGITTYNNVNLNGTAHTISGSNTFAALTLKADTTQTITFTDGTTQTITNPVLSGDSTHQHTLTGSGTAGWTLATTGDVWVNYCTIDHSTVTGANWYAIILNGNVDGGDNTGWYFTKPMGAMSGIDIYIPRELRQMFYRNPNPSAKYAIRNGYNPYGFSTIGLVLYLPLWALKNSKFQSVDAYGRTCTVSGATCLWKPYGRDFTAATPDYIDTATATAMGINSALTAFSMELWFKTALVPETYLIDNYDTSIQMVSCRIDGGAMEFIIRDGDANILDNQYGAGYNDNAWHNTMFVWDGAGKQSVFADGADLGNNTNAAVDGDLESDRVFQLGGRNSGGSFTGSIGEVRFYNRALSLGEATHNYNCTKFRYQ